MHTIPASANRESCLVLSFHNLYYEFGSIKFSDTVMLEGCFHIVLTNKVTNIDPISELIVSVQIQINRLDEIKQCTQFRSFYPVSAYDNG